MTTAVRNAPTCGRTLTSANYEPTDIDELLDAVFERAGK
jgi:hypothetical protein